MLAADTSSWQTSNWLQYDWNVHQLVIIGFSSLFIQSRVDCLALSWMLTAAVVCFCEMISSVCFVSTQNISQLQLQGAGRDLGTVVQSQHCIPYHQGSSEEIQDAWSWGAREGGLCFKRTTVICAVDAAVHYALCSKKKLQLLFLQYPWFLLTNFDNFSWLKSERISAHPWNKIFHSHLNCVATLANGELYS